MFLETDNAYRDSDRWLDEYAREADAREANVRGLTADFLRAAQACDASALATFAPYFRGQPQTMAEVVFDVADDKRFKARMVQVLLMAAAGRGTQREAQMLVDELAAEWADQNGDVQ